MRQLPKILASSRASRDRLNAGSGNPIIEREGGD
jgi:hypothetical protein